MIFKKAFGSKAVRLWAIIGGALLLVFTLVSVLSTTVFYELLKSTIGGNRAVRGDGETAYKADYATKAEAYAAANELNEKVNEEGIVLLKNENGALPLKKGAKVNVFGKNSVNLVYGGSGSGAGSTDGRKTLYQSLEAAGISYNQTLKAFYEDDTEQGSGAKRPSNPPIENSGVFLTTGETPIEKYSDSLWNSCADEEIEVALIVISRIGGEGFDLPRNMKNKAGTGAVDGANADDHYLQLDNNERALVKKVCSLENIKHVIVLINSSAAFELGFLDDAGHYAYDKKIDGALWIGGPGNSGIMALGRVLTGEVNPSGRLVDTYARDFTRDPTFKNIGNNMLTEKKGKYVVSGDQYMESASKSYPYYFVDYEEGIYVGYRYYETRGYTEGDGAISDYAVKGTTTTAWNSWYSASVVFPFGYGLSYTSFEQKILNKSELEKASLSKDSFTVRVEVKNVGSSAGKEVVELYATAPYTDGGIEKSHKVLCGFAKTPMLYPESEAGENKPSSCVIEITVDPYDIASYDYSDANGNGFCGYELEKGDYVFSLSKNAHTAIETVTLALEKDLKYEKDPVTDYSVENRFDGIDEELSSVTVKDTQRKGMSRTDFDGTFPTTRTESDRTASAELISSLKSTDSKNPEVSSYEKPKQAEKAAESDIRLSEMRGLDYNDEKWEKLLSAITFADMLTMVENGNFKSPAISYIGKPETLESDGPVGFVNFMDLTGKYYDTCSYASECVIAATWNKELVKKVGESIGNEGIFGNEKGDKTPYSGLYAPGVNIHRSPFGGRNFEYFSEDGFLSGELAAAEIAGAKEKGVYMYVKHFAVNEQETHRDSNGLVTWLTEQSMREVYLKPFEKAVKNGGTTAVMSSFNRIGTTWAGGDYRLLTEVLRNEWGFKGTVISDFNLSVYMNAAQMHYAGGDLNLTTMPDNRWTADPTSAADSFVLRRSVKNVLYTVANSCAMNGEVKGYRLPLWTELLIIADCVILLGIIVWGFLVIRKAIKT